MNALEHDELKIITITLLVEHVACGKRITLHGDNWRDVHGVCPHCDREYDVEFFPRYEGDEKPPRNRFRRRRGGVR